MRKKKSGLIAILVILVLILLAGGAFAYVYLQTDLLRTDKELFLKYFSQILEEGQFIDNSIKQYNEKKQQTPYENTGAISIEADIPEEYEVPVEKVNDLTIKVAGKIDKANNLAQQRVEIDYGNDIKLPITYRQYENTFGLQFDHFGSKYIAIRNEKLKEFAKKFGVEDVSQIPDKIEFSEVQEEIEFSAEEMEQLKQIYGTILQEQLLDENFTSIKTDVGESYTLELTGEQIKTIIIKMLEVTKQNTLLLDKINEYMAKIDEESESLDSEAIDELITSINEEDYSEVSNLKITLTQKDKMLNQIVVENENSKITIVKTSAENDVGYQCNIEIKANGENDYDINAYFNLQYDGIQTLNTVSENYELGFEISSEEMNMSYQYNINNDIEFKDTITIEEFDKNATVFLNDYEPEVITNFISQVGTRLVEINKKQMAELGLEEYENPLIYSNPITMIGITIYNMASDSIDDVLVEEYDENDYSAEIQRTEENN